MAIADAHAEYFFDNGASVSAYRRQSVALRYRSISVSPYFPWSTRGSFVPDPPLVDIREIVPHFDSNFEKYRTETEGYSIDLVEAGLPWRALRYSRVEDPLGEEYEFRWGIPLKGRTIIGDPLALPLAPVVGPFVVNVLVLGSAALTLKLVLGLSIQTSRRLRHRCPKCSYRLHPGALPRGCPECGWDRARIEEIEETGDL